MVSCKIYKLNPEMVIKFDKILNDIKEKGKQGKQYSVLSDKKITLNLYIIKSEENNFGISYNVIIDDYYYDWNYKDGFFPIKISKEFTFQIYRKVQLDNIICIYAPSYYSLLFANAIRNFFKDEKPLFNVFFKLDEKKDVIIKKYPEVKRFRVKNIKNDHEKRASIGGMRLENGHAWGRYVETLQGELTALIIKFKDMYVSISEDGIISCKLKMFEKEKESLLFELLDDLIKMGIIQIIQN